MRRASRKTPYTIDTEPVGFKVNYQDEGLELSGPAIIEPIVGSVQTLSVDPVQQSRSFSRWSDGVTAQQRSFTTGVSPQTFTAIFENRLPTARITADATSGQAPASFSFDGSASSDPEGDVLEFAWTDGRGGTSTSPTPTFSYPDPGTYDVQLTVTDQLGGTATAQVQVTVTPVPNRAPTAVIQTSTTSGPAPLAVDVSGAGSSDPDGDVLTYLWNYGDGATSTLADPPAHTYTTAGTYQLSLTVDDGRGLTGTSSVAITVGPSTPLPSGLVLGLGFDEGSGSSVLDVSGRGNNGTIAGATWTAGRYGQALSFDGTNDMVTVADAASLDFTQAFTISAWVRPAASSGGYRTVLIKERPRQLVYALYSSTNGASSPPGIYAAKGSSDRGARGGAVLPTGQWSHVAGTWDGATLRLYVNGTLRASTVLGGTLPNSAGALRIGGNTVWNEWFAGAIDEVRAYNRTLTPTEITTIKDRPVNG